MEEKIRLVASFAVLGNTPTQLRAVILNYDEKTSHLNWTSYFYESLPEDELEEHKIVTSYLLAGLNLDELIYFGEDFKVVPYPQEIPSQSSGLIYHAAEPGFNIHTIPNMTIGYGTIQLCGLLSLNGFAELHLNQVWIRFEEPFDTIEWTAIFDRQPVSRDFQIQQAAAARFASAFEKSAARLNVQVFKTGISPDSDGKRLIFARSGSVR